MHDGHPMTSEPMQRLVLGYSGEIRDVRAEYPIDEVALFLCQNVCVFTTVWTTYNFQPQGWTAPIFTNCRTDWSPNHRPKVMTRLTWWGWNYFSWYWSVPSFACYATVRFWYFEMDQRHPYSSSFLPPSFIAHSWPLAWGVDWQFGAIVQFDRILATSSTLCVFCQASRSPSI